MQFPGRFKIVHGKGQVDLVVPEVIFFFPIAQPGQFQFMRGSFVAEKDQREAAVGSALAPGFYQAQRLRIESEAFFQVQDVQVIMGEDELHSAPPGGRISFTYIL